MNITAFLFITSHEAVLWPPVILSFRTLIVCRVLSVGFVCCKNNWFCSSYMNDTHFLKKTKPAGLVISICSYISDGQNKQFKARKTPAFFLFFYSSIWWLLPHPFLKLLHFSLSGEMTCSSCLVSYTTVSISWDRFNSGRPTDCLKLPHDCKFQGLVQQSSR